MAVAMVLGLLVAVPTPASGGSGQIKVTHAPVPYKTTVQSASATAKAQSTVKQAKSSEIQVGVMPQSSASPPARRSVYIHR